MRRSQIGTAGSGQTVSIIIPCYNYGCFLAEAVESALAQTVPAGEIIIIDDGSTDETPQVAAHYAERPDVRVIRQENAGAIATFNRAIRASRGEYFVLLSADDRLDVRFLERTVPLLAAYPAAGYAYTGYRVFGARHRVRPALSFSRTLLARRPYFTASSLIRRAAFDDAGGYAPEMAAGYEDWDLYLTMLEHGRRGVPVPEVLFHYREHRVASRNTMSFRTWLDLLALIYERHRGLQRLPRPAFLARAVYDQYRLTLRAAPRAAWRRIGVLPAPAGRPAICQVASSPSAATLGRALRAAGAFARTPLLTADTDDRRRLDHQSLVGDASASLPARPLAERATLERAEVYHAHGATALAAAAVAATANRAILLYDPGASAVSALLRRALERALLPRVDGLLAADAGVAARYWARAGVQPVIRAGGHGAGARRDEEIEEQRLAELYRDLLAVQRPAEAS